MFYLEMRKKLFQNYSQDPKFSGALGLEEHTLCFQYTLRQMTKMS